MRPSKRLISLLALAGVFLLAGCGEVRPTAPPLDEVANADTIMTLTAIFAQGGTQQAGTQQAAQQQTASATVLTPQSDEVTQTPAPEDPGESTPSGGSREETVTPTQGYTTPGPTPTGATATPFVYDQPGSIVNLDFSGTPDPSAVQRRGPSVQARFLSSPPTIDGVLSDLSSPSYTANTAVFGKGFVSGASDLSAVFRIAWDNDNLYVGVSVQDSSFVQLANGPGLWQGDSIEILIDSDVIGDFNVTTINQDDVQLGISPGNLTEGGKPEAYLWTPDQLEGPLTQFEAVAKKTTDGWLLEASIPWRALGITPFKDQHLGFLFSVSDNDNIGMNAQQSMVSFAPVRVIYDPTQWFDLWLIDP